MGKPSISIFETPKSHSPGPWLRNKHHGQHVVIDERDNPVAIVCPRFTDAEQSANAAVLANSLELLQAAEKLLSVEAFLRSTLFNSKDEELLQIALLALTDLHVSAIRSRMSK